MNEEKISVIIPSYNSGLTVELTLRALDAQTKKNLISEIIVVDSSNDKETKRILSRYESDRIKVINAGVKISPAMSRNMGVKYATGKILAFLDADTFPAHDWLENIIAAYENGCLVGGGGIEPPDFQKNKPIAWAQYYLQFNEYMSDGGSRIKNFVPSCNMFCDRKLFQKVGGFPNILASEDVLFGLKASKITSLHFLSKAKVYHVFRENWQGYIKNQMHLGKYVCIYRKSYYDKFIYKGVMPLILFPAFLGIKLTRMVSRIFQAGWYHTYRFIEVMPIFFVGLLFWSIGFIKGSLVFNKKNF